MLKRLDGFDLDLLELMSKTVWKTPVELQKEMDEKRRDQKWRKALSATLPRSFADCFDDMLQPKFWRVVYRLKVLEEAELVVSDQKTIKTTRLSGVRTQESIIRYRLATISA